VNLQERSELYRKSGWQSFDPNAVPYTADQVRSERAACALADRPDFDARQGRDHLSRDPEAAVILEQLLLGIMVVAVTLLLLPFLWSWLASGRRCCSSGWH
jgi:hypothetical protein